MKTRKELIEENKLLNGIINNQHKLMVDAEIRGAVKATEEKEVRMPEITELIKDVADWDKDYSSTNLKLRAIELCRRMGGKQR